MYQEQWHCSKYGTMECGIPRVIRHYQQMHSLVPCWDATFAGQRSFVEGWKLHYEGTTEVVQKIWDGACTGRDE